MKTKTLPKVRKALLRGFFAASAILSFAPRVSAVPVTFAGGSGAPLTITLESPVSYTVTAPGGFGEAPVFVLDGVGNAIMSTGTPVTSNITYTINSGAPNTIGLAGSGASSGSLTADDIFFAALIPEGVNLGDVILLSAGFIITPPVTAAAPANGDYNTFIINTSGVRLSDDGTVAASVPDSLSTLWLGLPIAGMLALARLRQRRLE